MNSKTAERAMFERLRREEGYSIREAAAEVGVHYRTGQRWDRGRRGWSYTLQETTAQAIAAARAATEARRENYWWLRDQGESLEDAARQVGVCVRTAERYESRARAEAMRACA